jgi:hypothetical protein
MNSRRDSGVEDVDTIGGQKNNALEVLEVLEEDCNKRVLLGLGACAALPVLKKDVSRKNSRSIYSN